MSTKKRTAAPKLLTIPLTAQDLTITAFFATQQLLTNLSNTQDPGILLGDVAECLHTTPQVLAHLPIGTWDDNIIRAILESSVSHIVKEETSEQKITESSQTPESFNDINNVIESYPPNTLQTIDTEAPEFKDTLSLLGIARHLSNLIADLTQIASDNVKNQRTEKPKPKANTIASRKAAKRKTNENKQPLTQSNIEELLPKCLWFVHKGVKYFLLGRDADVSLGHIPEAKLTVADYVTMKAIELNAQAKAPQRDAKTGEIIIDRELKAVNGKPTGKVLTDQEYDAKMHSLVLQDIDIAFNLTIRQVAVLCRRAHEVLPQEITEREAFITERAMTFADAPAWIAFAIRGFFLERLLARRLIPAVNLISRDGERRQV